MDSPTPFPQPHPRPPPQLRGLPAAQSAHPVPRQGTEAMADTLPPYVLVVDDALFVRQLFGRYLARTGITVSVAEDGVLGVAEVRRRRPDAIVSDLEMPNLDGLAFCRALRADPE